MIKYLVALWHSKQRSVDLRILWPLCKKHAADMDKAKAAFAVHAFNDIAWMCLGRDEVARRIGELSSQ